MHKDEVATRPRRDYEWLFGWTSVRHIYRQLALGFGTKISEGAIGMLPEDYMLC
jgi:hypothetical protein